MVTTGMAYSCVLVHTWWTIHVFNVMLVCTWTAFSHTKGDVSSKKEDRFHCWSYMVELAKARPKLKGLIFVTLFVSEEVCVCHTRDVYEVIDCFQRSVDHLWLKTAIGPVAGYNIPLTIQWFVWCWSVMLS